MKRHADSHVDHGLTPAQVAHILERFADRQAFFIETFEFSVELGTVPCALWGPAMGDAPVCPDHVHLEQRGSRSWRSRMVGYPSRQTRTVTVIAGPHDGDPCILFTAFGGPASPQEPDDPDCKDVEASRAYWAEHALAR